MLIPAQIEPDDQKDQEDMRWAEIRSIFPDQWLVVEAIKAHTTDDSRRHLDDIAVVDRCDSGSSAFNRYRELHRENPMREYYYVHTSNEDLDITERQWVGVRPGPNANPA